MPFANLGKDALFAPGKVNYNARFRQPIVKVIAWLDTTLGGKQTERQTAPYYLLTQ